MILEEWAHRRSEMEKKYFGNRENGQVQNFIQFWPRGCAFSDTWAKGEKIALAEERPSSRHQENNLQDL